MRFKEGSRREGSLTGSLSGNRGIFTGCRTEAFPNVVIIMRFYGQLELADVG